MWTAASLWVVNVAVIAVYATLAVRHVLRGDSALPWALGLPALYFSSVFVLCASYFAIARIWRARAPRSARLGPRGIARLWWREYATLAGAPPRLMLYRWLLRDPAPAIVGVPVLLLHGVLCNAGVWVRFARFLRERGVAGVYTLSYGPPLASIESFADQLAVKIDAIVAATAAERVIIIAHSMGGLIARAYLRRYGAQRIARVLTIGAPHHGSMHAWFFPGVSLAQMRPGNGWLMELNRERIEPSLRFVSLWSWHDSMVAPQTSSELPGAADRALAGIGHNALLGDAEVFAMALEEITSARAGAA